MRYSPPESRRGNAIPEANAGRKSQLSAGKLLPGKIGAQQAIQENDAVPPVAELEFDVAEVVAAGEELRFGIPVKGFIITREVPGQDLAQVYCTAEKDERNNIMSQFGALLGRLHSHGFFGSTCLKDIISSGSPDGALELTLIDRETRNPYRKHTTREKVIARLLFNIRRQAQQGEIFTVSEWESFTEGYCRSLTGDLNIDADTLLHKILAKLGQSGKAYLPE